MHDSNDRPLLTTRSAELLVSAFFILLCSITALRSYEIGAGWGDVGPEAGLWPFATSMIVIFTSAVIFFLGLRDKEAAAETFVTVEQSKLVLKVLVPTIIYAATISFIGIYVASTIFIAFFMLWIGKYHFVKAAGLGVAISVVFYSLFEIWFHVPLPKGPLEALLGLD